MSMVLGLTGSFGSGKSTVSQMLSEAGGYVIDADQLARQAVEPETPVFAAIVQEFGPGVVGADGRLDRKALAAMVFGNYQATQRLNAIVHPWVRAEEHRLLQVNRHRPLVILDVPLLLEAGMSDLVDKVAVVTIRENQRFARLQRRGFSEQEVIARLGRQMPQSRKIAYADFIIDNSGNLEITRKQVLRLIEQLQGEELKDHG